MSIVVCKYRIATDEEVKRFIEYEHSDEDPKLIPIFYEGGSIEFPFMRWHGKGKANFSNTMDYNKSYKKLAEKYDLFVNVPIYESKDNKKVIEVAKYLKLVNIYKSWHQGWFMKHGWKRNGKNTDILFDNLTSFNKYCMKYMDLKCGYASETIRYFNDTFKDGEFIEIGW